MKEFSDREVRSELNQTVQQAHQVAYTKGEQEAIRFLSTLRDGKLRQFGPTSMEYATSLNDHATFCRMRKQFTLAIESLKIAVTIPSTNDDMKRNRLDSLIKLGAVLTEVGKLDIAEKILRSYLTSCQSFYGTDHEKYALGMFALSMTLLWKKDYSQAETLATQSVSILEKLQNPKVFRILVFRDLCIKAVHGSSKRTFIEYPSLHGNARTNMFSHAIALAKQFEPHYVIPFLHDLREVTMAGGKGNGFHLLVISTAIAYSANKMGNQEERISALEWTRNRPEMQDRQSLLIDVLITLAEAYIDNKNFTAAEKVLKEAVPISKVWSKDEQRGRLFRQFGIMYSNLGDKKKTDKHFQMALASANKDNDNEVMGRIQISAGIDYVHRRSFSEAKIMTNAGLDNLPLNHPDRLIGLAHLTLAETKVKECPCKDEEQVLIFAYQGLLLRKGIKPEQYEINLRMNDSGEPEIVVNPVYRKIKETDIQSTDQILQSTANELKQCYQDSKLFQVS